MITLAQAKDLTPGEMVHEVEGGRTNADGTPCRWTVNGQPKIWKRSPERVKVPIKHGLYSFDYLTEKELHRVALGDGRKVDDTPPVNRRVKDFGLNLGRRKDDRQPIVEAIAAFDEAEVGEYMCDLLDKVDFDSANELATQVAIDFDHAEWLDVEGHPVYGVAEEWYGHKG